MLHATPFLSNSLRPPSHSTLTLLAVKGTEAGRKNPAIVGPHSLRSANRPIAGVQIGKLQQAC